jgi:hypothetical protein
MIMKCVACNKKSVNPICPQCQQVEVNLEFDVFDDVLFEYLPDPGEYDDTPEEDYQSLRRYIAAAVALLVLSVAGCASRPQVRVNAFAASFGQQAAVSVDIK